MANGNFGGGDGTLENPYLVEDALDLDAVRNDVTAHYKQTADIDLGSFVSWIPIGEVFTGVYSGAGLMIKNLTIDDDEASVIGLFKESSGELTGIHLENVSLTGASEVGGIVGLNKGSIADCEVNGTLKGGWTVGGITSWNEGIIKRCCADVTIESGMGLCGGLVGTHENGGLIEKCYSKGTVTATDSWNYCSGGLVGSTGQESNDPIIDSYSLANVTGAEFNGGLVGMTYSNVSHCYSTGIVTADTDSGGLVGIIAGDGVVVNSYYDSETSGMSDTDKGEPKTTAELKDQATFDGWDFETTWAIDSE